MQHLAHFAAERARAHCRQTDGHAGLRNQRKAEVIANPFALADRKRAEIRARILADDAPRKIQNTDQQQRHAAARAERIRQRAEVEAQAGTHEEQQQNRRAPIPELAKQLFVPRQVDIRHAHGHAAQQRRNIRHRADAAEREQRRNRDDQPVIRRALAEKQLEHHAEQRAQRQHADIRQNRGDHGRKLHAAALRRHRHGNRDAVQNQADHVIQRDDLQERIDKIAVRAGLPDRHHGGSGGCGRGQRREHDGKAQFQMQHAVDEDEHRDRGQTGFQHGDDDHLRAVSPEHLHLEKLARAERDERQRHIRKKIRSVDDGLRNHIQAARPHQNARQNIARHIGQAKPLGDSRHCETGKQHGRNRNNDPRHRRGLHGFDQFSPFSFPIRILH